MKLDNRLSDSMLPSSYGLRESESSSRGFHRGALQGLVGEERERLVMDRLVAESGGLAEYAKGRLSASQVKPPVDRRLRTALQGLSMDMIRGILRRAGVGGRSGLRKTELVELACSSFDAEQSVQLIADMLQCLDNRQLALVAGLAVEGDGSRWFEPNDYGLAPSAPFTFAYPEEDGFRVFMPDELRHPAVAQIASELMGYRARLDEAASVLDGCTQCCGVIAVDDAYDIYLANFVDPLPYDEFEDLLDPDCDLCASESLVFDGGLYAVHFTLGEGMARSDALRDARRVVMEEAMADLCAANPVAGLDDVVDRALQEDGRIARSVSERFHELHRRYLTASKKVVARLIECHAGRERKLLSHFGVEDDFYRAAYSSPEALALRECLDSMVPDSENDYFFAERALEDFAAAAVEGGRLDLAMEGLLCHGYDVRVPETARLIRLATNLFNALPMWENNGWSPAELCERMTGRKVFYDAGGAPFVPGRNDPCPCGSGRKFKKCCGR